MPAPCTSQMLIGTAVRQRPQRYCTAAGPTLARHSRPPPCTPVPVASNSIIISSTVGASHCGIVRNPDQTYDTLPVADNTKYQLQSISQIANPTAMEYVENRMAQEAAKQTTGNTE